jgi:hypothetical protein
MKGKIKLKYISSSIGEFLTDKSYSHSEVILDCIISKDQNDIEFLDFDFKYPEFKVESNIKFYFELLDIGEDTFPEIGLFSISPSSIIKNNSQELIISGILSNIEMDTERVDSFSFIIKVVSDEINDYFIDKDCFVI